MRYRFAREGVKTIGSNAYFEPESIKWYPNNSVYVNFTNDFRVENFLGTATDFRREDDGWLTAEIEWNEDGEVVAELLDKEAWLTIAVNNMTETEETNVNGSDWRRVTSADLRVIFAAIDTDPWVEVAPKFLCPECAAGKLVNCVGQALHPVTDELVPCASTLDFEE